LTDPFNADQPSIEIESDWRVPSSSYDLSFARVNEFPFLSLIVCVVLLKILKTQVRRKRDQLFVISLKHQIEKGAIEKPSPFQVKQWT
jgi:hypothetical protein